MTVVYILGHLTVTSDSACSRLANSSADHHVLTVRRPGFGAQWDLHSLFFQGKHCLQFFNRCFQQRHSTVRTWWGHRHGCLHNRNCLKNFLVGGWATDLKNMLINWDHFSKSGWKLEKKWNHHLAYKAHCFRKLQKLAARGSLILKRNHLGRRFDRKIHQFSMQIVVSKPERQSFFGGPFFPSFFPLLRPRLLKVLVAMTCPCCVFVEILAAASWSWKCSKLLNKLSLILPWENILWSTGWPINLPTSTGVKSYRKAQITFHQPASMWARKKNSYFQGSL